MLQTKYQYSFLPFFDHGLCDRCAGGFESLCDGPEKKKGLHRWRPNNSVVGDEGCPRAAGAARIRFVAPLLACCAGKRFAFPQLRTLAGSNPMHWAQTKTVPLRGPFPIRWWAMRDVRVRLAPPASRFVAPLLACCAGKRFAFPQLRTLAGSNPMHWAQTKTVPLRGPFPIRWWAMRDSNPQPCACKAPALTVAPIARAERV